jgi:hypothetical protein
MNWTKEKFDYKLDDDYEYSEEGKGHVAIRTVEDSPWYVARVPNSLPDKESVAALLSAAPELYEALSQIISDLPTRRDWLDPVLEKMAKAALAKARGDV